MVRRRAHGRAVVARRRARGRPLLPLSALLRLTAMATHTREHLDRALAAFAEARVVLEDDDELM